MFSSKKIISENIRTPVADKKSAASLIKYPKPLTEASSDKHIQAYVDAIVKLVEEIFIQDKTQKTVLFGLYDDDENYIFVQDVIRGIFKRLGIKTMLGVRSAAEFKVQTEGALAYLLKNTHEPVILTDVEKIAELFRYSMPISGKRKQWVERHIGLKKFYLKMVRLTGVKSFVAIPILHNGKLVAHVSFSSSREYSQEYFDELNEKVKTIQKLHYDLLLKPKDTEFKLHIYEQNFKNAQDGVVSIDLKGRILVMNDSFRRLFGISPRDKSINRISKLPAEIHSLLADTLKKVNKGQQIVDSMEISFGSEAGKIHSHAAFSPIPGEHNSLIGITAAFRDITELKLAQFRLEKVNKELETLSLIDEKTKLYNERSFNKLFPAAIEESKKSLNISSPILMLVDIDHFKIINDEDTSEGHHLSGDDILVQAAQVLKEGVRQGSPDHPLADLVFRKGGDEFPIMIQDSTLEEALAIAERLRKQFESMVFIDRFGKRIKITISIGLARANNNAEQAFKEADNALYEAKNTGRNRTVAWVNGQFNPI
ncbi:diguanylate cyclase [Candidatus Margulisiibacteriota bacterium]